MIFAILGNILVLLGPLLTGKAIDYMKDLNTSLNNIRVVCAR